MTSQPTSAPRMSCEMLESRDNPSGNVSVWVSNGAIFIAGDAGDNAMSFVMAPNGDLYAFGYGTTVNGQASVYLGNGIPNGMVVDMAGGNDAIEIFGLTTPGPVYVNGGVGNDALGLFGIDAGSISVNGSYDNDNIYVSGVQSQGATVLDGAIGVDGVFADNFAGYGGFFVENAEYGLI